MMMSKRVAMSFLVTATLCSAAHAGVSVPDRRLVGLDRYIEQVRLEWKNIGVAVAVVQGSETIYAGGFGVRELGRTARVDADTLFEIGSTSKAFTTAALGLLVDEGKLHWDDPVIDHVPGFQMQDPWLTRHLTVRDVVTHRSGVEDTWYYLMGSMSSDEAVRQLRYITPQGTFRDSFHYSNLMYGLAGKIVEAASGATWHEFVKRRLLGPLRMSHSGTSAYEFWDAPYVAPGFFGSAPAGHPSIGNARDANVAMPHGWDENGTVVVLPWQSFDNAAAAGSVVSSVADMAHWMILHLNAGRFEGHQLLQTDTVRELHATQNLYGRKGSNYAMGWFRDEYRGTLHLEHGGGIIGFPAYVALLPERKMGVVVLSNGPKIGRDMMTMHKAIAYRVFDRLLGAPEHDWSQEFLIESRNQQAEVQREQTQLNEPVSPKAPPPLSLEQYAGVYEDSAAHSGRVNVRVENGVLVLRFPGDGAYSGYLEPWRGDLFRLHSNPGIGDIFGDNAYYFVQFGLDWTGRVVSMSAFDGTLRRISDR